jgi:GNAT superfamily N-acetyltransferase
MSKTFKSYEPIQYTVQPIASENDIPGFVKVQDDAFHDWPTMQVMYPSNLAIKKEESLGLEVKSHTDIWVNDPTAVYCTAKLQSGEIIGGAKWNFFQDSGPQFPWPTEHGPDANGEMVKWYFEQLDDRRNKGMHGKKHVLMAILAVSPHYQRCGIGARLLEWGLQRCDKEGLECWIDATDKGKGLYLKHGWVEVGGIDVDLERWGGEKGRVIRTANLIRKPLKTANVQ